MMRLFTTFIFCFFFINPSFSQSFEIIEKKGKYGVKNDKDEIILPLKYSEIFTCENSAIHLIAVSKKGYFLLNSVTKEIIQLDKYSDDLDIGDKCFLTEENLIRFYENGKTGLMYFPQKIILPAEYRFIYFFENFPGKCLLNKGYSCSIYDLKTKEETDWFEIAENDLGFNFDNYRSYITEEDIFLIIINNEYFIGNMQGKLVQLEKFPEEDYTLNDFSILLIKDNEKYGYTDHTFAELIPCKYEDAGWMYDYYTYAKYKGKYGIITADDEVSLPFIYDSIEYISESEFVATYNEKTVLIDESGYLYSTVELSEKDGKFGYIDMKNNVIIDYLYDYAYDFNFKNVAMVNSGGSYNRQTESVTGGKWGYILPTGELIIKCIYDEAEDFNSGIAKVTKDGNTYYIDYYGKCIKDCPEK